LSHRSSRATNDAGSEETDHSESDGHAAQVGDAAETNPPSGARFETGLTKRILQPRTVLSFAIAVAIAVFFLRRVNLDPHAVLTNIREANVVLLILAVAAYFAAFGLRSIRWRWMLQRSGVGKDGDDSLPSTFEVMQILLVAWFINCIVPAKLGDAYRGFRTRVDFGIRYSVSFGTLISERLIDLLVLFAMMVIAGVIAFSGNIPSEARNVFIGGALLVSLAVVGLIVLWFARSRVEALLPLRFQQQYRSLSTTLFYSLRSPGYPALISLGIWLLEAARVLLVAESVGVRLTVSMAAFVALMSALLTTLPITPAGLGVVEVAIIAVLRLANVPVDLAGTVAFLDRLITYWLLIVVGLIVYLLSLRSPRVPFAIPSTAQGRSQSESSST
jgi:glycosyltransferase 2 family protein